MNSVAIGPGIEIVQAEAAPAFGFPFNGFMITGGSSGLRTEWMRMRQMGAAARMMLEQAAAARWGADPASLSVVDGVISDANGNRATFAELALEASKLEVPDKPALKPAGERTVISKPVKRLDTEQKATGRAWFGIDVDMPGLLTAVVVGAPQLGAPVKSFSADKALARPGVISVVQISSGVAIVGDHYWAVHSARDDVEVEWGDSPFAGMGMDELRNAYRNALKHTGQGRGKQRRCQCRRRGALGHP